LGIFKNGQSYDEISSGVYDKFELPSIPLGKEQQNSRRTP